MSGESSKLLKVQVLTPSEGSNIPEIPLVFSLEHDPMDGCHDCMTAPWSRNCLTKSYAQSRIPYVGISNQSVVIWMPPGHCDWSASKVSSQFFWSKMELDYQKIEHQIQSVARHQQGFRLRPLTLTHPKDNEI